MKRRLVTALTLGLLLVLAVSGAVLAQGPGGIKLSSLPGSGWWVSWQVQNVGDAQASLQVQAMAADGESFPSSGTSTTLDAGAAITFVPGHTNPLSPPLAEGFIGSAVLSSDQPIVAIGNVANNPIFAGDLGVAGGIAAAQYQGVSGDDAATQVNFPLLKNDFAGQTTTYYVQAAGQPARVTMTYNTNDGGTYTDGPYELQEDEMHVFSTEDVSGLPKSCTGSSLSAPCVGSAVATSDTGPIVGVYTEHQTSPSDGVATFVMSTRGFTPSDADTTVAAPVMKNNWFGRTTALTVQNAETSGDTTVNVEFNGFGGDCASQSYSGDPVTLTPGASTIYFPNLGNMGGLPENCIAAATVTSSGAKVVAIVNESGAGKKTVYGAFGVSNTTRKVALPLHKEDFAKRTTGLVIQNTGGVPTDVTVTFNVISKQQGTNPGTVTVGPFEIPAQESRSLYRIAVNANPDVWGPAVTELQTTNSGVIVTSDSENIVAIAQESGVGEDVDIKNYEGFNID